MTGMMMKMFGGAPKPQAMAPMPAMPSRSDTSVADAADEERKRQRMAAGRASTNATGDSGVTTPATVARTVLGGYRATTGGG